MKKACIGLDNWKLPIFESHLKKAGYVYETCAGVTHDTLLLTVPYEEKDLDRLHQVILDANTEAAILNRHKGTKQ